MDRLLADPDEDTTASYVSITVWTTRAPAHGSHIRGSTPHASSSFSPSQAPSLWLRVAVRACRSRGHGGFYGPWAGVRWAPRAQLAWTCGRGFGKDMQ